MTVVIQCAAGKQEHAGHLRTLDGRTVMFVARPDAAPPGGGRAHARPDDVSDTGKSWRTTLQEYNAAPGNNPLRLLPAWQLYKKRIYGALARHCGPDRLYVLSAGWGLIRADFLTPNYDITFSRARNVEPFKRRRPLDAYCDFRMLPARTAEPIMFFGGKDYVDLFCLLTERVKAPRLVWYNSGRKPRAPGCELRRFHTKRVTAHPSVSWLRRGN